MARDKKYEIPEWTDGLARDALAYLAITPESSHTLILRAAMSEIERLRALLVIRDGVIESGRAAVEMLKAKYDRLFGKARDRGVV